MHLQFEFILLRNAAGGSSVSCIQFLIPPRGFSQVDWPQPDKDGKINRDW